MKTLIALLLLCVAAWSASALAESPIARDLPRSIEDLHEIPGIGERKAARFGEDILKLVKA